MKMNLKELRSLLRQASEPGTYPHQLSFLLELPFRRLILSPKQLADRLHLSEASEILEVGPGPGFFSVEIARRLSRGHLRLMDLQIEMLQKARSKLQRKDLQNAGYVQANGEAFPFVEGTFDVAFLVTVLGEVGDPSACLGEIYRVLRPSGLLSVTEQMGDPDFLPLATVQALAKKQYFELVETFGKGKNFTANFRKTT